MNKHPKLLYTLVAINSALYLPYSIARWGGKGIFYGVGMAFLVAFFCWTTFDYFFGRYMK